jgi:phosphoribosylformylglycinamidine synthase
MKNIGLAAISEVRIGKHITLTVDAETEAQAAKMVQEACEKLLANAIMERFDFTLTALETA